MKASVFPPSVQRARSFLRPRSDAQAGLFDFARVRARVVEISEAGYFGALSAVCGLVSQVQARRELIAWVATGPGLFFPPDLAYRGIDVEALTVILAPGPPAGLQAADGLVRSGAFGLVVVDWAGGGVEEAALGRLARLAEDRQTAVVFLTRKRPTDPSLATQVSLRGVVFRNPDGETGWVVTKDKQPGPPVGERISFDGPFGLY